MSAVFELEKQILALSVADRERVAILAWESLVGDVSVASDERMDRAGMEAAAQRDAELESGSVQPMSHSEFIRGTSSKGE